MQIFISACKGTDQDQERMQALYNDLQALNVRQIEPAKGRYKGIEEDSFAVLLGNIHPLQLVFLGEKYQQESILIRTMNDIAFLKYMDNSKDLEHLGEFFEQDDIPSGDYTFLNGKYLVVG